MSGRSYGHIQAAAGSVAGSPDRKRYWCVSVDKVKVRAHHIIYEMFNGPIPDGLIVDHKNRNNTDNRKDNLRAVTQHVNARNARMAKNNQSGLTGVSLVERKNSGQGWTAHWLELDGRPGQRCFSVNKYGYEAAKQLATDARAEAIARLNAEGACYSEEHGKEMI